MKRINTPTSSNGRFVDGNKITGRSATQFNAEWCNQIQEEICNLIKALTGAEPTGQSEEELKSAFMTHVAALGLKSIELYKTASGSNVLRKFLADGDGFDISVEGEGASDNSHVHFGRTGFYYEKSSSEPTRSYKVEVDSESVKVTDANHGGTFTAELKGGVVRVKRGNNGSEMDYEKVTTPLAKADSIEGTSAGTGSAGAKEVVVKSGLHIKNDDGGSHYLRVEGASTFEGTVEHKYDVHLTCHGSQQGEVDANLAVDGKTTSKILQVGLDANKALEADYTGVKIHKTCTFNSGINIGGIVIDCSAETGAVLVNNVIADAGITELRRVVVLYCVSGQTVTKGTGTNAKSITLTDNVALPFYISGTELQPWPVPMFIANWTRLR